LGEAINTLIDEAQGAGIVTEFKISGDSTTLNNKTALALYRTVQEGLTNVRRHAHASRIDVLLDYKPDEVCLKVKDNGVGTVEPGGGFGLLGIRERMHLLGGSFEIETSEGNGFCLTVCVPISLDAEQTQSED
jgi:signal transduction histidine kinase